ncbi:MAG TPA: hypothetical protein PLP73_00100 [Candidatus Absconditabacterales bacterium]|nr:hypothetical protein [Candidatus Absconditabacterales bacterium]
MAINRLITQAQHRLLDMLAVVGAGSIDGRDDLPHALSHAVWGHALVNKAEVGGKR